jgi:hypothetical protein
VLAVSFRMHLSDTLVYSKEIGIPHLYAKTPRRTSRLYPEGFLQEN